MAISPSAIVPEILKKDNYERWRILMQHHFEAQDLWNVVILNTPPVNEKREWTKKNASALLAIKISCEAEVFDKIKEMKSAKKAWDALADMQEPSSSSHEIAQRKEDVSDQSETVQHHKDSLEIEIKENVSHVIEIGEHPADDTDIKSLCKAIRCGKTWALYGLCKPALLLRKVDSEGRIPVQLACNTGHERTARILYRKTRDHCRGKSPDVLTGKIGFHFLKECITKKMFDIAYDLLQSYPNLAELQGFHSDFIPLILTFAQTPTPFIRGSQLIFWKRWIYNCTRVKADTIKEIKMEILDDNYYNYYYCQYALFIIMAATCPWILPLLLCAWICLVCVPKTTQFIKRSLERAREILKQSLTCARKIIEQPFRKIPEQALALRKVTHQSCDEFRGTLKCVLDGMLKMLLVLSVELLFMPFIIVTVVALPPISMCALILGEQGTMDEGTTPNIIGF